MRWAGNVAYICMMRNAYKIFIGKPEGMRSLRKPMCTLEDNIRMYLSEIGWKGMEWIHVAQDGDHLRALVNTTMVQ
jgi:hypothetical protein